MTTHHINVTAKVQYIREQSLPEADRYVFAYTITVTNTGSIPAKLLRRHWLITDANSQVQEVWGDGVVGEQPDIMPGQSYQYTSAAILATTVGCMEGHYEMLGEDGVEFNVPILAFNLSTPNTLH